MLASIDKEVTNSYFVPPPIVDQDPKSLRPFVRLRTTYEILRRRVRQTNATAEAQSSQTPTEFERLELEISWLQEERDQIAGAHQEALGHIRVLEFVLRFSGL